MHPDAAGDRLLGFVVGTGGRSMDVRDAGAASPGPAPGTAIGVAFGRVAARPRLPAAPDEQHHAAADESTTSVRWFVHDASGVADHRAHRNSTSRHHHATRFHDHTHLRKIVAAPAGDECDGGVRPFDHGGTGASAG